MTTASGDDFWRQILTGQREHLKRFRWLVGRLPREPRCPLCLAPFNGIGGALMRLINRGPATMNPKFCDFCERQALENPGGAEVELTMFVADVRGSTILAERLGTTEYTALMNRFYNEASEAVIRADGLIDKFVGDAIVALFVPGFAGRDHAGAAIAAALNLLRATGNTSRRTPWIPIGVGIHTGTAYVGVMGPQHGAPRVTAMGDAMNVTARLADSAGPGEAYISEATLHRQSAGLVPREHKALSLKGISEPVDVGVCEL